MLKRSGITLQVVIPENFFFVASDLSFSCIQKEMSLATRAMAHLRLEQIFEAKSDAGEQLYAEYQAAIEMLESIWNGNKNDLVM
jgi:hypothetical protein